MSREARAFDPSKGRAAAPAPAPAHAEAALSGSLSSISLFDVCQFLMLNRKTGTLTVRSSAGTAYFTFQDGQLLTALNDALRDGEEVVIQAVQWNDGAFEFSPGPVPPDRKIHVSTENILLEAARKIDEQKAGEADASASQAPPTSQEGAFRDLQERAQALSEAFRRAVGEENVPAASRDWKGTILHGLAQGKVDRVLVGPGGKVCLQGPSGLQTRDGLPEAEVRGWIEELVPVREGRPRPVRHGGGARRGEARLWTGAGGVRLWAERFADPEGDWVVLCHPRGQFPTWEQLGLTAETFTSLEQMLRGGFLVLGRRSLSLAALAAFVSARAQARPPIAWVVERRPLYDWPCLPGRIRSLHPSLIRTPGALTEILEASRAEMLLLAGIRDGRLLAEAFRAADEGILVILQDQGTSWEDWFRRLDLQGLGPGEDLAALVAPLQGVWSVREARPPARSLLESQIVRRGTPERARG